MAELRAIRLMSPFLCAMIIIGHLIVAARAARDVHPKIHVPSSMSSGGEGVTYKGTLLRSARDRLYAAFNGIPYAKPPVGDLRFEPPVLLKDGDLKGNYDATNEGSACVHLDDWITGLLKGNEDCLFLNVFVPSMLLPSPKSNFSHANHHSSLLPVMVWIHGGGFVLGSSDQSQYSATYLMDRDIVLVTINYRLHLFGFLSTEDTEHPGNMGLLDQAAAIKWVNRNIKYFGGDPDLVTVFGESAGGVSAHIQMLSPHNEGLIHRAICQSGLANAPFALQPDALKNTQNLARLVNCPTEDTKSMMDCLKKAPAFTLTEAQSSTKVHPFLPLTFVPRIDKEANEPFLPDHPLLLMRQGRYNKIPWMTGVTKEEGLLITYGAFMSEEARKKMAQGWNALSSLFYMLEQNFENQESAKLQIEENSLAHPVGTLESMFDITKIGSEMAFEVPAQDAIEAASHHTDTYAYLMDYPTPGGWIRKSVLSAPRMRRQPGSAHQLWGTAHADDLQFLFKLASSETIKEETNRDAYVMKELFLDTFVNFARTGNPNVGEDGTQAIVVPWPSYKTSRSGSQVFVFNPTPKLTNSLISKDRAEFWRSLLRKFGRPETKLVHTSKDEL